MTPRVEAVYVGRDATTLVTTPEPALVITWAGVEGDRHAGLTRRSDSRTPHYRRGTEIRNSRQVSLVSGEELAVIAAALGLPSVRPEWLGANLAVAGLAYLTRLPPSTRLSFPGEAVLVVDGENLPCQGPGKVLQAAYPELRGLARRFPKAAFGLRGLVAWVERPGIIRVGDEIRVAFPKGAAYPATDAGGGSTGARDG